MAQVADAGTRVQTQRTSAPPRNTGTANRPTQNPNNGNNAPRDTFTPSQANGNNSGEELWSTAKSRFGGWDKDGDGFVTNKEVETALKRQNLSTNEKAALETFRGRQSQLEESHNDEWGDENNGTSLKDIDAFRTAGDGEAKRLQEQFRIEQGLALEPRSVKDRALANKDAPADLNDKIGTRDYYIERYKDFRRRNPGEKAPDYYLNYGLKYFDISGRPMSVTTTSKDSPWASSRASVGRVRPTTSKPIFSNISVTTDRLIGLSSKSRTRYPSSP